MLKAIATEWKNYKISHQCTIQIWIWPVVFFKTISRSYKIVKKNRNALLLHHCALCSGLMWYYTETPLGYGEAYLSCLFGFSFPVILPSLTLLRYLGLTSPFVLDGSVDFSRTPVASWLAVCLPMVEFLQSHSARKRISPPPGPGVSLHLLPIQHHVDGPGAHLIRCA